MFKLLNNKDVLKTSPNILEGLLPFSYKVHAVEI